MPDGAITRAENVLFERVGDDTVVLDPATGCYTCLNASGSMLWELLSTPTTATALGDRLVREFGVDPATARRDAERFVDSLREQRLLDRALSG